MVSDLEKDELKRLEEQVAKMKEENDHYEKKKALKEQLRKEKSRKFKQSAVGEMFGGFMK